MDHLTFLGKEMEVTQPGVADAISGEALPCSQDACP